MVSTNFDGKARSISLNPLWFHQTWGVDNYNKYLCNCALPYWWRNFFRKRTKFNSYCLWRSKKGKKYVPLKKCSNRFLRSSNLWLLPSWSFQIKSKKGSIALWSVFRTFITSVIYWFLSLLNFIISAISSTLNGFLSEKN